MMKIPFRFPYRDNHQQLQQGLIIIDIPVLDNMIAPMVQITLHHKGQPYAANEALTDGRGHYWLRDRSALKAALPILLTHKDPGFYVRSWPERQRITDMLPYQDAVEAIRTFEQYLGVFNGTLVNRIERPRMVAAVGGGKWHKHLVPRLIFPPLGMPLNTNNYVSEELNMERYIAWLKSESPGREVMPDDVVYEVFDVTPESINKVHAS